MRQLTHVTEHVDVLIVGTGPAGATHARVVADAQPEATILVVEVGPKLRGVAGEHTANMVEKDRAACQLLSQGPDAGVQRPPLSLSPDSGVARGETFVFPGLFLLGNGSQVDGEFGLPVASMASGVGGMGVYWAGLCPRPDGIERVPYIPAGELDDLYDRAEALLRVSTDLNHGDPLLSALREVLAAEFDVDRADAPRVDFMPVARAREGDRIIRSGPATILDKVATRGSNFEIRAETLARRILVEGGRAVGALLEDRVHHETYQVKAQRVVVCADSLRTPQLLFASGIRPAALGHYLNDHFQMSAITKLRSEYIRDQSSVMSSVRIPFVDGVRAMQGQLMPLSAVDRSVPFASELAGPEANALGVLGWYGSKDLQYGDCVAFSETAVDHYGMPAMTIHYTLTDNDDCTIDLMRANATRCAACVGELLTEPTLAPGGSSLHYQGTVRMGASEDGTSVCDSYGRVWGVENLYVGGNGLIPTPTATNPTLTTVAFAVRAADHLAATL